MNICTKVYGNPSNICQNNSLKATNQLHGSAIGKVRRSTKSLGFILFMAIHLLVVEIFQPGPLTWLKLNENNKNQQNKRIHKQITGDTELVHALQLAELIWSI